MEASPPPDAIPGTVLRSYPRRGTRFPCATAGAAAVARYREAMEEGRPFDIVVMDLTLPGGIGGQEATRQILQLDPEACVVVSGGYSTASVMANYREHGFSGVLAKPYTLEGLLAVVSHLPPHGGCPPASRSGS